jgi:cytoskeleton protein RodZ
VFEIGNSLHEARLRRRIEFAQAEQATKIRGKYLRALEDERFDQLPAQTYVKGFLRTYADYLGLDGQLYVDEYNSRFVAGEDSDSRPRRSRVRPERRNRTLETNVVLLVLAVISIVTVVVISAWKTSGNGTAAKQTKRTHVTRRHVAVSHADLEISAVKGQSYVAVHRGGPAGKILFEGTVDKGKTEPFTGTRFWLNVSSPENLTITVRGKQVPLSGHRPLALTVTPTGVHPD